MKIVFRNFFKNECVNQTLRTIRFFMPEVDVYCLSFYKKDCKEYQSQPPLDSSIHNIYRKTNIVVSSSYGNTNNGAIFEEGYNEIYEIFKDYDGKILILAEDHFFTSGKILKEFKENEDPGLGASVIEKEFYRNQLRAFDARVFELLRSKMS